MGAGGASAPPRRIISDLGGKELLKGKLYIQKISKKEDSNSALLIFMNTKCSFNSVIIIIFCHLADEFKQTITSKNWLWRKGRRKGKS